MINFKKYLYQAAIISSMLIPMKIDAAWARSATRLLVPAVALGTAHMFSNYAYMSSGAHTSSPSSTSSTSSLSEFDKAKLATAHKLMSEIPWANIEAYHKLKLVELALAAKNAPKEQTDSNVPVEDSATPSKTEKTAPADQPQTKVSDTQQIDEENRLFTPEVIENWPLDGVSFTSDTHRYEAIKALLEAKYKGPIPTQVIDLIGCCAFYGNFAATKSGKTAIQNRILLQGEAGSGKSYLAKSVAYAVGAPYQRISASYFKDKYIGEASRKIRKALAIAKEKASAANGRPVVLCIDEIDTLATARKESTHDEQRATLITLLTELEELHKHPNLIVFVGTNDHKALDEAFLDRFAGAQCTITRPDLDTRVKIITKLFQDHDITAGPEYAQGLAEILAGYRVDGKEKLFSARDIEEIIKAAKKKRILACGKNSAHCNDEWDTYFRDAAKENGKPIAFKVNIPDGYIYKGTKYKSGIVKA